MGILFGLPAVAELFTGAIALISYLTGQESRDVVEQLDAEDRGRLEEMFGSVNQFIQELETSNPLSSLAGVPNVSLTSLVGSPQFGDVTGQGLIVTLPDGTRVSGVARGNMFESVGETPFGQPVRFPLSEGPGGAVQVAGFPEASISFSDDQALRDFFQTLTEDIPGTPRLLEGIDVPRLNVEDALRRLETLGGGFIDRGDLTSRFTPAAPIEFDPSALRSKLSSELFSTIQEGVGAQQEQAFRSLASSGVLPGSAAFEFETTVAPQQAASSARSSGLVDIEEEIEGRRLDVERTNRDIDIANQRTLAQLIGAEEATIGSQIGAISNILTEGVRLGQNAATIELSAADRDIANDFQEFGTQFGVSQAQLGQFNQFLAVNAHLAPQQKQLVADLLKAMMAAELQQAPTTVTPSEIFSQTFGTMLNTLKIFGFIDPSETFEQKKSASVTIAGFGGGYGCIDGRCMLLTPRGRIKLSRVKLGDAVLGADGKFHRVIGREFGWAPLSSRDKSLHLFTTRGNILITQRHPIAGRRAGLWRVGDIMPWFDDRGVHEAKIVNVRLGHYVLSGDVSLDGNVPYVADGFVVHSVIGRISAAA